MLKKKNKSDIKQNLLFSQQVVYLNGTYTKFHIRLQNERNTCIIGVRLFFIGLNRIRFLCFRYVFVFKLNYIFEP